MFRNPEDMFRKSNIFVLMPLGEHCGKMLRVIKWNESLSGLGNSGFAGNVFFGLKAMSKHFFFLIFTKLENHPGPNVFYLCVYNVSS